MRRFLLPLSLTVLALAVAVVVGLQPRAALARPEVNLDKANINKVLDALHEAASKADGPRYFSCFSEDAVFLGTDETERWPMNLFKEYAAERFSKGQGWTYTPTFRCVYVAQDRTVAWFDELLSNQKYGVCRGSGVLINNGAAWLVTQYNLSKPIPNDLFPRFAGEIKEWDRAKQEAFEKDQEERERKAREAQERAGTPAPK